MDTVAYNLGYGYDAIGNMTTNGSNAMTYGDAAHKHAVSAAFGNTYSYDANGNQTSRTIDGTVSTFTYDYENRLTAISGGATASFVYDADGNRVKSTVDGVTTVYIAGMFEFIENGATDKITKYYDGNAMRRSGYGIDDGVFYLLQDHLKSSSSFVNQAGATLANNYYYPYGGNRGGAFSNLTTKRFTGQYHESSLPGGEGLSYYNARWYDPKLGRFLSADTIVPDPNNPQAFNRYSYVINNPLNFTDPTGHDPWGGRREDPRDRIHGDHGLIIPPKRYLRTLSDARIDRSHWDTGDPGKVIADVRRASQAGGGIIQVEQSLSSHGLAIGFRGTYVVWGGLTEEQIVPVAHGIYRDWSWRFEWWEYTLPTEGTESAFANEDLPTQELGFIQDATGMSFEQIMSYLGPATGSEEQLFETMNPFDPRKNHFFTPRVQNASGQWVNIPWPSALTLTPLGPDSGLWTFHYQQTGWGFGDTVLLWGTPNASINFPPLPALPPKQ